MSAHHLSPEQVTQLRDWAARLRALAVEIREAQPGFKRRIPSKRLSRLSLETWDLEGIASFVELVVRESEAQA